MALARKASFFPVMSLVKLHTHTERVSCVVIVTLETGIITNTQDLLVTMMTSSAILAMPLMAR